MVDGGLPAEEAVGISAVTGGLSAEVVELPFEPDGGLSAGAETSGGFMSAEVPDGLEPVAAFRPLPPGNCALPVEDEPAERAYPSGKTESGLERGAEGSKGYSLKKRTRRGIAVVVVGGGSVIVDAGDREEIGGTGCGVVAAVGGGGKSIIVAGGGSEEAEQGKVSLEDDVSKALMRWPIGERGRERRPRAARDSRRRVRAPSPGCV